MVIFIYIINPIISNSLVSFIFVSVPGGGCAYPGPADGQSQRPRQNKGKKFVLPFYILSSVHSSVFPSLDHIRSVKPAA